MNLSKRSCCCRQVERRGLGRLFLECQVHAFVATVLLGTTRLDALDLDPQPEPPDRKLGESEQGVAGGEGSAIVGADGVRKAEVLEGSFEHREGKLRPC